MIRRTTRKRVPQAPANVLLSTEVPRFIDMKRGTKEADRVPRWRCSTPGDFFTALR